MLRITTFLLLLLGSIGQPQLAVAQSTLKKVTISVVDANTGKPVEGAEVSFKSLFGKLSKKTNSEGKAFFDMALITERLDMNYTVTVPSASIKYKTYTGSITLVTNTDVYDYKASMQSDARQVAFKITDDKRQAVVNATVKLLDDNGNAATATSDLTGIASFDIPPNASYSKASLVIAKEGFNDYTVPVEINAQTSQVAIVAPLTRKATTETDKAIIITDNPVTQKKDNGLLEPTQNVTGSSSAMPPGFKPVLPDPPIVWGPYQPDCFTDALGTVPVFTSMAVEEEKTLLDHISTACIGAAGEAVDALADMTEQTSSVISKLRETWSDAALRKDTRNMWDKAKKLYDTTLSIADDGVKAQKSIGDALEKTKDLLDKMKELAAGPEMYAVSCIWDGIKSYAIPAELTKLKKTTEAIGKAKEALQGKMEAIKKRMAIDSSLTMADKALFTDWKDVTENIGKSKEGLSMIWAYIKEPVTILPYESQVNWAISSAEKLIGTMMNDCQIRECDRQIKQGTTVARALLTAARKLAAQKHKCVDKWRQNINDYVTQNFKKEDRGWEHFAANDYRLQFLPQGPYGSYRNCKKEAEDADKEAKRLEEPLKKLGALCAKIQPLAATLNERVRKYEELYRKGLVAVGNCKLDEAEGYKRELMAAENSACGHFFPKPYGQTKSAELAGKIGAARTSGKCNKITEAGWLLESLVIDPDHNSKQWRADVNVSITENKVVAHCRNSTLTLNITSPPKFIKDGEAAVFEASTSYEGDDDNVEISLAFTAYGGFDVSSEETQQALSAGKILDNGWKGNRSAKGIYRVTSGNYLDPVVATISPQVFIYNFNVGPRIFEAKYRRVVPPRPRD